MNCDRINCTGNAVAIIPRPDLHGQPQDINVCEAHFRAADAACFYVIRNDEEEGEAHSRFMGRIKAKHFRLRRSNELAAVVSLLAH
jgi:hypothetical protein